MKFLKTAAAICLCLIASALIFSCSLSGDMPAETSGYSYRSEQPSHAETGAEPVPQPETEPQTQPQPAPSTEEPPETDGIAALIGTMTLEEKVGQMFLVACDAERAATDVAEYHLGGLVLFAPDFADRTPQEAADAIASYQAAAKIPLLIAVDEEGGTVVRVSKFAQYRAQPFKSPAELYREGGLKALLADVDEKTQLLRSLGINCNLAPVCDVSLDPESYIYPRTLGLDARTTAELISSVTLRYVELGMGCVLKHFPGYGGNTDTHKGMSVDSRDFAEFEQGDLLPFIAGIHAGAGAVMVSHNIVTCIDPDYPSSLSASVHSLLRDALGFEGVIVTDALDMGAIKEFSESKGGSAAVLAILAGTDMVCISDFKQAYDDVMEAVKDGLIPEPRIDASVERVLRWKEALGILS